MARILTALVAGFVFGLGLTVSQMINPAKVLGFLDLAGDWDPSLAFVMLGAIPAAAIGYGLARRLRKPLCVPAFPQPAQGRIDRRLAIGAVLFGIGWGLVGYCPGPALASLGLGNPLSYLFVAAMVAGMAGFAGFQSREARRLKQA
ncbi:MAG TPA: YeeE/YedE family protein [Stellaceae bacterium]|nr:YeeE/YedE family protein [Stellaceae bacterium]